MPRERSRQGLAPAHPYAALDAAQRLVNARYALSEGVSDILEMAHRRLELCIERELFGLVDRGSLDLRVRRTDFGDGPYRTPQRGNFLLMTAANVPRTTYLPAFILRHSASGARSITAGLPSRAVRGSDIARPQSACPLDPVKTTASTAHERAKSVPRLPGHEPTAALFDMTGDLEPLTGAEWHTVSRTRIRSGPAPVCLVAPDPRCRPGERGSCVCRGMTNLDAGSRLAARPEAFSRRMPSCRAGSETCCHS